MIAPPAQIPSGAPLADGRFPARRVYYLTHRSVPARKSSRISSPAAVPADARFSSSNVDQLKCIPQHPPSFCCAYKSLIASPAPLRIPRESNRKMARPAVRGGFPCPYHYPYGTISPTRLLPIVVTLHACTCASAPCAARHIASNEELACSPQSESLQHNRQHAIHLADRAAGDLLKSPLGKRHRSCIQSSFFRAASQPNK